MSEVKKSKLKEGEKYNRLTAIGFSFYKVYSDNKRKEQWKFKCDCGNIKDIEARPVYEGKVKSCGCLQIENGIKNTTKLNSFYLNNTDHNQTAFNKVLHTYKMNARKRDLDFNITEQEFRETTKQNCKYCGIEPSTIRYSNNKLGKYIYNGIDRKDNSKGYFKDNCVPCCRMCNTGKGSATQEELQNWLIRLVNNNKHLLYV